MKTMMASISILFLAALVTMNPAIAGDRLKIFQMGESGQMVSFPLTAEEIGIDNTEIGRRRAIRNDRVPKGESDLVIFELAESGEIIEFLAKEVEIFIEGVAKTGPTVKADEENTPLAFQKKP